MKKWLLVTAAFCSFFAEARPYRFYLDSSNAEQVLARINFGPRLGDREWLKLINFDRDSKRQIQSGDNLWNIASAKFGNPFLWRKIWQENPWLTNPHDLEVGRILAYYNEGQTTIDAPKKIPIVKLRPDGAGMLSDVDNDIYVNKTFKARYRLNYLVIKPDEILGEITGSYSPRTQLSVNDEMYLSFFENKKVGPGSRFTVVREDKDLRDKTQVGDPVIGKMVKLVGEVKVISNESDLARVEITAMYFQMSRGDKIIMNPKVGGDTSAEFPPSDLIPQVVMLDEDVKNFGKQGDLVTLNKGGSHGMKEGFLFKIFEDTDPVKGNASGVLPTSKGEIRVVYVGEDSSVGVISRNSLPIRIGDSLLSFPELPSRLIPPKKARQEISID